MTAEGPYIFAGTSNEPLARAICEHLGVPLRPTRIERFSNGTLKVQLGESVRNKDVYIIQSLTSPVHRHIMQLLMMLDIARTGDAARVTAVIPYYSYARSDKKDAPRISITAKLVARLIETAGADRAIAMALHSAQTHGFFDVPLDHLTALRVMVDHFKKQDLTDTVVVSPDVGYAKQATKRLCAQLPLAVGSRCASATRKSRSRRCSAAAAPRPTRRDRRRDRDRRLMFGSCRRCRTGRPAFLAACAVCLPAAIDRLKR